MFVYCYDRVYTSSSWIFLFEYVCPPFFLFRISTLGWFLFLHDKRWWSNLTKYAISCAVFCIFMKLFSVFWGYYKRLLQNVCRSCPENFNWLNVPWFYIYISFYLFFFNYVKKSILKAQLVFNFKFLSVKNTWVQNIQVKKTKSNVKRISGFLEPSLFIGKMYIYPQLLCRAPNCS